jgi:RNA ligase (TIGR02306 family)
MSEWKPEVVSITRIEKHPNADNLDIAYLFENYPCIVKRGQYTVGSLVGYIPVDSIVPDVDSFAFLSAGSKDAEGNRKYAVGSVPEKLRIIKARKIRSVYSMGLIVDAPDGFVEGQSIAEHFGLKKWEEEEEENVVSNHKAQGRTAKSPKGWQIPHYDLEGLRRLANALVNVENVYISEKLHGAWFGAVYRDGALWVKSRNLYKDEEGNCMWWQAANKYGLKERLQKYPDLVLCGECYGQVGGFKYDTSGTSNLRFFDIFDTKRRS